MDNLFSVDAGNGRTDGCGFLAGEYVCFSQPSIRAVAIGENLGLGEDVELRVDHVDWLGNRYVTGDDAIRITRRRLERHMGADRYGDEMHRFLVANALARMGVVEGELDLVVYAPPGLYRKVAQGTQRGFTDNGAVKLRLSGDSRPREWRYGSVVVLPEGLGALNCVVLDACGDVVEGDLLAGQTLVLDVGAYTLDALLLEDGRFNPESLPSATLQSQGVNAHLCEPLLKNLHARDEDFARITIDDLAVMLRSGDYTVKAGGRTAHLVRAVNTHTRRYGDWITNNVLAGTYDGLRGIKCVLVVGGGATLVQDALEDNFGVYDLDNPAGGGKILVATPEMTDGVRPAEMNAVGGLRLALRQLGGQ